MVARIYPFVLHGDNRRVQRDFTFLSATVFKREFYPLLPVGMVAVSVEGSNFFFIQISGRVHVAFSIQEKSDVLAVGTVFWECLVPVLVCQQSDNSLRNNYRHLMTATF